MAVSFVEEPYCRFDKTAFISNSEHLPAVSKATVIIEADGDKESNECKHFTIRGYVAEVRKRDTKNCWPFLLHNCASVETAKEFPPLPVAKFRWWGCKNCVCEIISTTAQMATGEALSIQNQDAQSNNASLLGNDAEAPQLDAGELLCNLPQISNENNLEEILKINDCFLNFSRAGKEENECLQRDLLKEGFHECKSGQDGQSEIQNAVGESKCVSNEHSAVNKVNSREYGSSVGRKKIVAAHLMGAVDTAFVSLKRTMLQKNDHPKMHSGDATAVRNKFAICRSKEDKWHERRKAKKKTWNLVRKGHMKVNIVVGKDDALDVDPAHTLCSGACWDKQSCRASVDGLKYTGLFDDKHQFENEVENTQSRKFRKVRLLEDIIRSEKENLARNIHAIDGSAKTIQHAFIKQVASKEKIPLLNHARLRAYQNNASKSVIVKRKSQHKSDEDEDLGYAVTCIDKINHCVRHRNQLKSVKRKDKHENQIDEDEGTLLVHLMKSVKDHDIEVRNYSVKAHKQKTAFSQNQTFAPEGDHATSSILIGQDIKSKNFSSQDFSAKEAAIIEKTQHCSRESTDRTGRNAILHKIRNKKALNGKIKLWKKKDSSFMPKKASLDVRENVSMKPRNRCITDQEALDDIPMDIVELLAKNQHDRYHLTANAGAINKLSFPAMTESNPSDARQESLSCQKFEVSNNNYVDFWTTFPCNGEMDHKQKACGSINEKKMIQIDLNQQYGDSLISRTRSYNLDASDNCHLLNLSSCRSNSMYSSESIYGTSVGLSRISQQDGLRHIDGASFGENQFLNNLNAAVLERDLKMFTRSSDYEKQRNLAMELHHWGFSPTASNTLPFIELANNYHSNLCPTDLHSNETISASNLLKLMDQAAFSGESRHHYQSNSGLVKEIDMRFNGQYNESQLEFGCLEKEPGMYPLEVVNSSTFQQPRNSCLLFRPHPRIGILGPSLQKDIFNISKCSTIPPRSSHGLLKTDVSRKLEPSCLNLNALPWRSRNSCFTCKCSEKNGLDRDLDRCPDSFSTTNTRFSAVRGGAHLVESNENVDSLLPLPSFCKVESCVVNRNPSDFTVLDENNEYMIERKQQKLNSVLPHESFRGQKKQRVMKLNDLKAFAMK